MKSLCNLYDPTSRIIYPLSLQDRFDILDNLGIQFSEHSVAMAQNDLKIVVFAQISVWMFEFDKDIDHLIIVFLLLNLLI